MKKNLFYGSLFILGFIIWTVMIQTIDVKPLGVNGTNIGLSTINCMIHEFIGTNMTLYVMTDWLGLIPVFICLGFGVFGLYQWIQRKSLFKVDYDILILGIYYMIVIFSYVIFEMLPINYRPILIEDRMEVSYPSSTTLLVCCVMLSLYEQINRRFTNCKYINMMIVFFTIFMVLARILSGVHWFSDIVGSLFISFGYYFIYKEVIEWNFMKNFRN